MKQDHCPCRFRRLVSVVLVWREDGAPTRWKNLQDVWHRLGDQDAFSSYVHGEVAALLEAE